MNSENKKGRPKQKQDKTFQERFLSLVGKNTSHTEIADRIGTSRQNVGNWLSVGTNTKPDIYTLAKIAKAYNVSTDYLLGLNEERTSDVNVQSMHRYTGLNEKTIEMLHILKENNIELINLLSELLYNNSFLDILRNILTLKNDSKSLRDSCTSFIEKGSSFSFNVEKLDVLRYSIHKILGTILDCYDLRCESDYKQLEDKIIDRIDFSMFDSKK